MEEKDKSKQGEELLEVDEKGKAIEKKVEEKKPKKKFRNIHLCTRLFPLSCFTWSFPQNFYF